MVTDIELEIKTINKLLKLILHAAEELGGRHQYMIAIRRGTGR